MLIQHILRRQVRAIRSGSSFFGGANPFFQVDEPQTQEEEEDMFKFPYRKVVVALMWTVAMTRPSIACAVRALARFWNSGLAHY